MTLYFLKYNNYYNRMVKKEDSLEGYLQYAVGSPLTGCINWNPNDGVDTEQVVNSFSWETYESPDYVVVVTDNNKIDSRWFVIENTRLRNGQMKLLLHRDVVVDNYNAILQAPMFIEKATPLSTTDPAIYNKENMDFNQIKTSETLLKDETGIPWVVGYIPRDSFKDETTIMTGFPLSERVDDTVTNLSDFQYYKYKDSFFGGSYKQPLYFNIQVDIGTSGVVQRNIAFGVGGDVSANLSFDGYSPSLHMPEYDYINNKENVINNYMPVINTMLEQADAYTSVHTEQELQDFLYWNNRVIYESSSDKYWKVVITKDPVYSNPFMSTVNFVTAGSLFNTFEDNLLRTYIFGTPDDKSFSVVSYLDHYLISFEEQLINASVTIGQSRANLNDSPYDMFCIPYGDLQIHNDGEADIITNGSIAIPIATAIGAQSGSLNIYDIQLLPYCPLREAIKEDGTFDIADKSFDAIKDGDKTISYLFWCYKSDFTFNIPVTIDGGNTVLDRKVINETQMYRICSPNYNGVFEFNPAKNNGVSYVNVDCTYKPYAPYIHINPDFKGLYGSDFNDARGLILGGDFSLPQVTNAWADYQLQNKNYQASFDRQIQNLEVQREVQRVQQAVGIGTGVVGGAASGAMTGALASGPFAGIGAAIGGVVGGISSLAGGITDYALSEKLYNENLDYKKDMFGYQLGNIKAIPSSLAKTTALTSNNKLFPFVEYYTCTDQEVQALKDKLKYNGYSIGRIGKMIDYLQSEPSYIKGQIIRIEGIADDFHGLKAISDELYKGVFI